MHYFVLCCIIQNAQVHEMVAEKIALNIMNDIQSNESH